MRNPDEIYGQRPSRPTDISNLIAVLFLLAVGFITGALTASWLLYHAWNMTGF